MIGGSLGYLIIQITCCVRDNLENGFFVLVVFKKSGGLNAFNFFGVIVNTIFLWKLALPIFKRMLYFKKHLFTLVHKP